MGYDVLVRICTGLGVPRELMGLAYHGVTTEPELVEEVDEDVERRNFLAIAGAIFSVSRCSGIPTR